MSRTSRVLIIEEDPAIRRYLRRMLREEGYRGTGFAPGGAAFERLAVDLPDLVILDLDARDSQRGIERIRAVTPAPILALSVHGDEGHVSAAIERGADDYLVKPFGRRELLARLRGALRRTLRAQGIAPLVSSGDLTIDLARRLVRRGDRAVRLAPKPYAVLTLLVAAAGRVLAHEELLASVWGPGRRTRRDYLRLAIRHLRSRIEPDPAHPVHILTEHGVGYRFQMQAPADAGTMPDRSPAKKRRA